MWHYHSREEKQNNTGEQEGEPSGLGVRYSMSIPTSHSPDGTPPIWILPYATPFLYFLQ
jgi:hypothetical protein